MNIISISPLLIYYNSLSIPLVFGLSNEENLTQQKTLNLQNDTPSTIFPVQNSNNIWRVDNPIIFSPLIKCDNLKKNKIYLTSKYSYNWSSDTIILSNFDSSYDIQIPIDDDIVSLTRCYALCNSNLQPNTILLFVSPKYAIINQTSEIFSIDLFNGESVEIYPNSTIPVTLIRKSLQFSVAIIPKTKKKQNLIYSRYLDIEKINSQYISVVNADFPVLLEMSVEKEIHFITMMLNRSLPYLFINKTDVKVIFVQKNTNDLIHEVLPNESLAFYLFDESMPPIIFCDINNEIQFEFEINTPTFPIKIENNIYDWFELYYYVDISSNKGSVITLIKYIDDQSNSTFNMDSNCNFSSHLGLDSLKKQSLINILITEYPKMMNKSINFNLSFSQISITIITEEYQELCNSTLKDIIINSVIHDFETSTQVTVGSVKVDDQNKYAAYPTVFQILPNENSPAVQIKINAFGSHKYGKIDLDLKQINFQIDLSFVSDFIGDIFYFDSPESFISNEDDDCIDSNDSSDENVSTNYFKFKMDELPFSEIIHNIMPKQNKYHIKKINIHPFIIHIAFHTTTSRADHQLQDKYEINHLIGLIPSFNDVMISIDDIHSFVNLSGTIDEIMFNISHEIKRIILNQLSFKNSIIGTKTMIVNGVKSLFKPETATEGILKKTNLCLSICESTLCYFSSILNMYTNAHPNIRNDITSYDALSWGISTLTSSFKEGAKVLFLEPYKRGNINGKNDFCGYLFGTTIGLTKCTANMASGICIFAASLFSSTRRLFFTEKMLIANKREREPLLGMHGSKNDYLLWYTGSLSSCLIEVYTHSIYILKGDIVIKDFVRVEINKKVVIIYDALQNIYKTNFDNENQSIAFYKIVKSQLFRRQILDAHDKKSIDENI